MNDTVLCCPSCQGTLKIEANTASCAECRTDFPMHGDVVCFVDDDTPVDPEEMQEIQDLVRDLSGDTPDNADIYDSSLLPNRKNTIARRRSEEKALKSLKEQYGSRFEGARVLEFSCGAGRGTRIAAEMGASEVWVVDISPVPVTYCLDTLRKAYPDKRFEGVVATSEILPFREDSFDILLIYSSFHHYPNQVEFLEKASRFAKNIFILSEPAELGSLQPAIEMIGLNTEYGDGVTERVSETAMVQALQSTGMKVNAVRHSQYFPAFFEWAGNSRVFSAAWFGMLNAIDAVFPREWKHSLNLYATRD